jgi:hypothetical protein
VIYRDGQKLTTTKQPNYVDSQPSSGHHIYCVSIAFDNEKESEPVCIEAISYSPTGLSPIDGSEKETDVYPNPVQRGENLIIRSPLNAGSILSIYTITGQLIQQEQITEPVHYKKMDFEPGTYLIEIKNNSKIFTRKIIVK